jgi:UDP-N-acetylmuramoylalanine--D-glutamate ligase
MSTRPKISWSDLQTGNVGLWGLGVEGQANLRRLQSMDVRPVLVDDHPSTDSMAGMTVSATERGGLELLARCDVVVKTPGISRYRRDVVALKEGGVAIAGGLGLWLEETPRDRVVCITGTKGKSTTTAMVSHLLNTLGYRCAVGGNIGVPPWDPDVEGGTDVWAVETSSFQATDVASTPPVVAVTSLSPDHLDWHGDAQTYMRDKLSLCHQPGAVLTIADGSSTLLRQREDQLGPVVEWISDTEDWPGSWLSSLPIVGAHSRRNALMAEAIIKALGFNVLTTDLADAISSFEGLESRLQSVGAIGGVRFVDDSLSTNPLPACAAIDAYAGDRLAILVGGFDRGVDYGPLAEQLAVRGAPTLVVTMPDNGPRIGAAVLERNRDVAVIDTADLDQAVRIAFEWAAPEGVVLLSPAAPSFGHFADYRDRARAFVGAMDALR